MFGPRARSDLSPETRQPMIAEEGRDGELGRLDVGALVETGQQFDSGPLGFLLGLVPAMPLADPAAVRAAAEVEHDAVPVAALDDGASHCSTSLNSTSTSSVNPSPPH